MMVRPINPDRSIDIFKLEKIRKYPQAVFKTKEAFESAMLDYINSRKKILEDSQKTLAGRVCYNLIQSSNTSLFSRLFLSIFKYLPGFKDLINTQKKALKDISNVSQNDIYEIRPYLGQEDVFATKVDWAFSQYRVAKRKNDALNHIVTLFGGKEGFEKIPVLDLDNRYLSTNSDSIKADEMTAPIMRGQDRRGRLFFCIKEGERVQTFFETSTDNKYAGDWSFHMLGRPAIVTCCNDFLLGNEKNEKFFEELQAWINKVQSS